MHTSSQEFMFRTSSSLADRIRLVRQLREKSTNYASFIVCVCEPCQSFVKSNGEDSYLVKRYWFIWFVPQLVFYWPILLRILHSYVNSSRIIWRPPYPQMILYTSSAIIRLYNPKLPKLRMSTNSTLTKRMEYSI